MVDWAGREVILRYVAVWVGGCEDMVCGLMWLP